MESNQEPIRYETKISSLIRVGQTRRKGKGMFVRTNASIAKETVLLEEPGICIDFGTLEADAGSAEYIQRIKDREEQHQRQIKLGISRLLPDRNDIRRERFDDRLTPLPGISKPLGVFLKHSIRYAPIGYPIDLRIFGFELSRFNHACIPNAVLNVKWTEEFAGLIPVLELRAVVDLQAGDEICISYNTVVKERTERQRILKAMYNFDCKCLTCQLGNERKEDCFRILNASLGIIDEHPAPTRGTPDIAIKEPWNYFRMASNMWNICEELQLFGEVRLTLLRKCSVVAAMHSDIARFEAFLTLAVVTGCTAFGTDNHRIRDLTNVYARPDRIVRYQETLIGESTTGETRALRQDGGCDIYDLPWLFMSTDDRQEYLTVGSLVRERDLQKELMRLSSIDIGIDSPEPGADLDTSTITEIAGDETAEQRHKRRLKEKKKRHAKNKRARNAATSSQDQGKEGSLEAAGVAEPVTVEKSTTTATIQPVTIVAETAAPAEPVAPTQPNRPKQPIKSIVPAVPDVRAAQPPKKKQPDVVGIVPLSLQDVSVLLSEKGARRGSFAGEAWLELRGEEERELPSMPRRNSL